MFRVIGPSVFLLVSLIGMASCSARPSTVDLNEPGALEALQRDNPAHYQKVREILKGVLAQPDSDVPQWVQTSFNARDVRYGPLLLTSYPPKRDLSFVLNDTRYVTRLTLVDAKPSTRPAK